MISKRANESVGMSVNVIFSIFLIVVFISVAFVAIKFFLNVGEKSQIGNFYEDLQYEINNAWSSAGTEKTFEIDLPRKVEYICFVDLSSDTGKGAQSGLFEEFDMYDFNDLNIFIYPREAAGDFYKGKMEHLNITKITSEENPYCVNNSLDIKIIKNVYSPLVQII